MHCKGGPKFSLRFWSVYYKVYRVWVCIAKGCLKFVIGTRSLKGGNKHMGRGWGIEELRPPFSPKPHGSGDNWC